MQYPVKILHAEFITPNVKRFKVERPLDYAFKPGQSTNVSINTPEWKDKLRPFTFTNLATTAYLEFLIKIYDDHDGVTKQLGSLHAGAELLLHDVYGSLTYQGSGFFIAAGGPASRLSSRSFVICIPRVSWVNAPCSSPIGPQPTFSWMTNSPRCWTSVSSRSSPANM